MIGTSRRFVSSIDGKRRVNRLNKARYVISALALDRVGLIHQITTAITNLGGNVDGMSQTVIHGYFTMIMTATFQESYSKQIITESICRHIEQDQVSIVVREFENTKSTSTDRAAERYIMTLTGRDRPGILKLVTGYLAEKQINIDDYYFQIQGEFVTHIGEISIPVDVDIKQMKGELQTLVSSIDLVATLQHENLFRAANEIFAIRHLFSEKRCEK